MTERKYEIQQVSCNSRYSRPGSDIDADNFLFALGFKGRGSVIYMGAVPRQENRFYVYHNEPAGDEKGKFRFVRNVDLEGKLEEEEIDHGDASESHIHEGLNTLTFYGSGWRMPSWSFHCKR